MMSFLPAIDIQYLIDKKIEYEEVVDGSNKGIILKNKELPSGKYDAEVVDVLVIIPPGFPDISTDMFYTNPWIKLISSNQYPKASDQPFQFNEIKWQRWSRHSKEWRPGKDGIRTVVKRIQHAIDIAI